MNANEKTYQKELQGLRWNRMPEYYTQQYSTLYCKSSNRGIWTGIELKNIEKKFFFICNDQIYKSDEAKGFAYQKILHVHFVLERQWPNQKVRYQRKVDLWNRTNVPDFFWNIWFFFFFYFFWNIKTLTSGRKNKTEKEDILGFLVFHDQIFEGKKRMRLPYSVKLLKSNLWL